MGDEVVKPKRRKKTVSPTALSMARLRRHDILADVVERWVPMARKRKDLANVIDIVAYGPEVGVLGIQATTGDHHANRRTKAIEEPRLRAWLEGGGRFQVWSWTKRLSRWELRVEELTMGSTHIPAPLVTQTRSDWVSPLR